MPLRKSLGKWGHESSTTRYLGLGFGALSAEDGAPGTRGGLSAEVVLVGGEALADLVVGHGVGVSIGSSYDIKRAESNYLGEA